MPSDDFQDEMGRILTDVEIADHVVSGRPAANDAPEGMDRVAALLAAARGAPTQRELEGEAQTVAAMAAIVRSQPTTTLAPTRRKRLMLIPSLRLRTAAIFAALVFASTGGLAAAGALPDQAEEVVSAILSELGLSLPDQAGGVDPAAETPVQAENGLAIAAIASESDERSVERGALVSTIASDGKSQAGERGGAGAADAPVATPNEGGTPTADAASGGASEPGTSVADAESGGASAAGSGNADVAPVPDDAGAGTGLDTAGATPGGDAVDNAPAPPTP
jgi:hypothetical protein